MSRILIFAEAVTLAHVARPIALSRILHEQGHEVCIAAAPAAQRWLIPENVARQEIGSIEPTRFLRALARGMPAYGTQTLKRYVEDDLRAIAAWNPDIVIGDFRLSLHISARLAAKPYGAIANAYWSRRYWTGVDAPAVPPLSWLPRSIADATFRAVYPAAFALHALPFHRACKWYGVDSPGLDIRDVYTASDSTGFADVEAFYEPTPGAADAPVFIGPLAWEPPGSNRSRHSRTGRRSYSFRSEARGQLVSSHEYWKRSRPFPSALWSRRVHRVLQRRCRAIAFTPQNSCPTGKHAGPRHW